MAEPAPKGAVKESPVKMARISLPLSVEVDVNALAELVGAIVLNKLATDLKDSFERLPAHDTSEG
jgi:hypothetical protein